MYNLITIALCFIIILLIRRHIKNKPLEIEIQPAEETSRQGFTLSWIDRATDTVNVIFIAIPSKATRLNKLGIWSSVVVGACALVNLIFKHFDGLVSFFGRMFT